MLYFHLISDNIGKIEITLYLNLLVFTQPKQESIMRKKIDNKFYYR